MPPVCLGPYLNCYTALSSGAKQPLPCLSTSILGGDGRTCAGWGFLCSRGAVAYSPPAGSHWAPDVRVHTIPSLTPPPWNAGELAISWSGPMACSPGGHGPSRLPPLWDPPEAGRNFSLQLADQVCIQMTVSGSSQQQAQGLAPTLISPIGLLTSLSTY